MERIYWGIAGAGKISNDFVNALNDPTGPAHTHAKVVAVAARERDRAQMFADYHGITTVYGSYQELADDDNINVVYIGNTIGQHYEVVVMMLNAGKHVLCEKSLTLKAEQSKELFELAATKKLFLMEAVWSNFFPTYKKIAEVVASGDLGDVVHVEASFGIEAASVFRLTSRDLGGGAALDLGIYLVNFVRVAFQREVPEEIIVKGDLFGTGVDASWDVILVFSKSRRAVLKCSAKYKLSNTARITFSKGHIEVPSPFHAPPEFTFQDGSKFSFEMPNQPKTDYNFLNSACLSFQAAASYQAISAGKLGTEEYTSEDTLYIARILDEIRRQLGVNLD